MSEFRCHNREGGSSSPPQMAHNRHFHFGAGGHVETIPTIFPGVIATVVDLSDFSIRPDGQFLKYQQQNERSEENKNTAALTFVTQIQKPCPRSLSNPSSPRFTPSIEAAAPQRVEGSGGIPRHRRSALPDGPAAGDAAIDRQTNHERVRSLFKIKCPNWSPLIC